MAFIFRLCACLFVSFVFYVSGFVYRCPAFLHVFLLVFFVCFRGTLYSCRRVSMCPRNACDVFSAITHRITTLSPSLRRKRDALRLASALNDDPQALISFFFFARCWFGIFVLVECCWLYGDEPPPVPNANFCPLLPCGNPFAVCFPCFLWPSCQQSIARFDAKSTSERHSTGDSTADVFDFDW